MSNDSNTIIAVALSDIPGASRQSDSDYLTAICIAEDKKGQCTHYQHDRDTPGVDRPDV